MTSLPLPTKWADGPYGRFLVYANGDCISETIAGQAFWDGGLLLPFYDRWSRPDGLAIEIGAFCGQGAVYLAQKCGRVLAVEPVNFKLMLESIEVNPNAHKIHQVIGAAYSRDCTMEIPQYEIEPGRLNPGGTAIVPCEFGPIQGYALDRLVEPGSKVCLIKSDAQGSDLHALMGLAETIKRDRPPILFEFEDRLAKLHGHTWGDHLKFFSDLDYTLEEQAHLGYPNNFVALPK